jgi:hypothetical protein
MKITVGLSLCLALFGAPLLDMAIAATPNVIAESARTVAGGRALQVLVAQSEIKSDINPSILATVTGGGLLGGLLEASENASNAKEAEAAIEPLRAALTGFDVDSLALETAKASIGGTPWLQITAVSFGKDSSPVGKSRLLDNSLASQVAFVEYTYDASPDFLSIRVVANIQFANKTMPAGTAATPVSRLAGRNLAYAFTIRSVVSLPGGGDDINVNANEWSANRGTLARAALTTAFAKIGELTSRAFALTVDDVKAMSGKDKEKGEVGGFRGRVQGTDSAGTLLWTGGFVHAQVLP